MNISAFALALPLLLQAAPPSSETGATKTPAPLTLEQSSALRCSTALAVIAAQQKVGEEAAMKWPVLGDRGKEFFVRTTAKLMDDAHLTREGLRAHLNEESNFLKQGDNLNKVMPACLALLDASGL